MERQERWLDVNYLLSLRSVNDDDLWSRVAVAVHSEVKDICSGGRWKYTFRLDQSYIHRKFIYSTTINSDLKDHPKYSNNSTLYTSLDHRQTKSLSFSDFDLHFIDSDAPRSTTNDATILLRSWREHCTTARAIQSTSQNFDHLNTTKSTGSYVLPTVHFLKHQIHYPLL